MAALTVRLEEPNPGSAQMFLQFIYKNENQGTVFTLIVTWNLLYETMQFPTFFLGLARLLPTDASSRNSLAPICSFSLLFSVKMCASVHVIVGVFQQLRWEL